MADEPKKSDDIESILSDLNLILSDTGGAAPAPVPAPQLAAKVPPKIEALAPPPAAAAAPAAVAAPEVVAPGEVPANTPKEQIRRVAYAYTAACGEAKLTFAAFLSQAARTISKKPLFLREVLAVEVGAASDANAVVQKALQAKATSVLAVVEGWPPAKIDELSDACARANLLFRSVASADAQKKSTAVDIIVDMILLPGEA